jgi:hypothetical protein
MALQIATLPYPVEVQIISAFVLMILGLEIDIILVMHRRKNPGSGVALINSCLVGVTTLVAIRTVELAYILLRWFDADYREVVYGMTLVIVDIGSTALFSALRQFTRSRPALFKGVIPAGIALSIVTTIFHVIELASARPASILPVGGSVGFTTSIVFVPTVFVLFLHAQSDRAIKPYYKCIVIALVMLGLGGGLHLVPVEDLLAGSGVDLTATSTVSMAFSVAGVTLFFVTLFMMPYIEDLYWQKAVVAVYVLNTSTGRAIFKRTFQEGNNEVPSGSDAEENDAFLMGGLSGMVDFVREITNSAGGNLEFIDKGELKFMLSPFKQFLFIVISRASLPVIRAKLFALKSIIISQFGDVMKGKALDELQRVKFAQIVDHVFKGGKAL